MGGELCMTVMILFVTLLIEMPLVVFYYWKELGQREKGQEIKNADMADFMTERLIEEIFPMLNVLAGDNVDFHRQIAAWQERYNSMLNRKLDVVAIAMHLVAVMSSYEKIELIPDVEKLFDSIQCFVSSLVMKNRDDYSRVIDEFLSILNDIRDIKTGEK